MVFSIVFAIPPGLTAGELSINSPIHIFQIISLPDLIITNTKYLVNLNLSPITPLLKRKIKIYGDGESKVKTGSTELSIGYLTVKA